jgi:WD40 repeat protein
MNKTGKLHSWAAMVCLVLSTLACYPRGKPTVHVNGLAWSPDGTQVALYGQLRAEDGGITIFDVQTGQPVTSLLADDPVMGWVPVADADWAPDGARFATTEQDRVVIWDTGTWEQLLTLSVPDDAESDEHRVRKLAWSPDGTYLAGGLFLQEVVIWDTGSGEQIQILFAEAGGVSSLAWSPGGEVLAVVYGNGSVRTWDTVTGDLLLTFEGGGSEDFDSRSCCGIAWTPDGTLLAVQWPYHLPGDPEDHSEEAIIWEVETGEQAVLPANVDEIVGSSSFFSPDGRLVAHSIGDGDYGVWDVETGERINVLYGPSIMRSVFSPDWTLIAAAPGHVTLGDPIDVSLWDPETGELLLAFEPVYVKP